MFGGGKRFTNITVNRQESVCSSLQNVINRYISKRILTLSNYCSGELLYEAQQACIDAAKNGCPISDETYESIVSQFNGTPVLYDGTSSDGLNLALKVLEMDCCTEAQFVTLCADINFGMMRSEDLTLEALQRIRDADVTVHYEANLSESAAIMQEKIAENATSNDNIRMNASEMAVMRKDVETMMENMFTDPRVSRQDLLDWQQAVVSARFAMIDKVNEQFGTKG